MKKTLPLVLSIIMLTACAPAPTPTPSELAPTPLLEVQMQWEVPDEGFSVIPAGEEPQYFYDKPLDSFVPSEDYGRIYPYLGHGETLKWEATYQYGLCTENGEIITAPIYSAPMLLGFGEKRSYLLFTGNGTPEEITDDFGGWTYYPNGGMLVGLDGSWTAEFEDMSFFVEPYFLGTRHIDGSILAVERDGRWGGISTADGSVTVPFRHENGDAVYGAAYDIYFGDDPKDYWFAVEYIYQPYTYDRFVRSYIGEGNWRNDLLDKEEQVLTEFTGNIWGVGNDFFLIHDSEWTKDFEMTSEVLETRDKNGVLLARLDIEIPEEKEVGENGEGPMREFRVTGDYVILFTETELLVYDRYFSLVGRFEPTGAWRYYGYFLADCANQSVQIHSEAIYISDANTGLHRTYRPDGTLLTTCYFGGE